MLKIQVTGHGMIPRGLGIAPRMEPFPADRNLIYTILQTPNLKVKYLHPENGKLFPLTRENMKKVLDKFQHATYDTPKTETLKPHTPEEKKPEEPKVDEKTAVPPVPPTPPTPPVVEPPKPVTPPQNPPKNEEKPGAPETKVEEKKEESKPEEKKPEEPKVDEKTAEKTPSNGGGLKPVLNQGQNSQDKKSEKK